MEQWTGAVAIVTGASAGIGETIAIELVKKGLKVVGIARRIDRLNKLKEDLKNESGEFHPIKCDMTIEEDILAAFQWTRNNLGGVNLLVNNAGTGRESASLTEGKTSDWKLVIDLNLLGLCIATREAVKIMKENDVAGLIVHINSVAGHYPLITHASMLNVYGATKYGVTNLAETLRLELAKKKSKIRVTSISPGAVKTEIMTASSEGRKSVENVLGIMPLLEPVDIANAVLYLMTTPSTVNVTELTIRPIGEIL